MDSTMGREISVSLCIVAYNEEEFLPNLFQDIIKQTYPHNNIEIILVDSGSTDGTRDIMNRFASELEGFQRITVLDNPKRRQASGWNVAITEAGGDVIFRIDAHAKIPNNFVSNNIRHIEEGEYVSGGPRPNISEGDSEWQNTLLLAEKSMFGSGFAIFKHGDKKQYVKSVFHGAYRKEVFEHAGLFNENLGRTEDNEMHYRIRKRGYKICYSPDVISYQYTRSTWKGMMKQKYGNGYWIGLTTGVCPQCLSLYHFVPLVFVLCIIGCMIFAMGGIRWPLYSLILAYGVVNIIMTFLTIYKEKKNWTMILIPIVFLSLHISYGTGTLAGLIYLPVWRSTNK